MYHHGPKTRQRWKQTIIDSKRKPKIDSPGINETAGELQKLEASLKQTQIGGDSWERASFDRQPHNGRKVPTENRKNAKKFQLNQKHKAKKCDRKPCVQGQRTSWETPKGAPQESPNPWREPQGNKSLGGRGGGEHERQSQKALHSWKAKSRKTKTKTKTSSDSQRENRSEDTIVLHQIELNWIKLNWINRTARWGCFIVS